MKRRPKHPIAELRAALGKTQQEFAKLIGKSMSYVRQLEQGKKPVTEHIATLLMLLYGCERESLKNPKGRLKHILPSNAPLPELIVQWEEYLPIAGVDAEEMFTTVLMPKFGVLLDAAITEQSALNLLTQLDSWITETAKTLGLEGEVKRRLREREKSGEEVDWEPLVGVKDDKGFVFDIPVSDPTAALLNSGKASKASANRGPSQVNPGKFKQLVRLARQAVQDNTKAKAAVVAVKPSHRSGKRRYAEREQPF